ncbi:penicillin-binding protein 2 [Hahella sp. HN01]|uniref:peptidoglycan D,D-transpeptidase FtsI family protein n=1 Tax=Hahella sp. HN01 TaxID=2847262 RepID=UPI001C1F1521|nr:penicillin-binding transpeptidase domain-containing protein [Hahella sp. HN01]MBU6951804.1 penicillin-binding protein 2 [Hahella sp. HN01]
MKANDRRTAQRGAMEQAESGQAAPAMLWRYYAVAIVLVACFIVLVWRVIDLQVINHEFLRSQGDMRTVRVEPIQATRGKILDRNGEPLAVSAPVVTLWANPQEAQENDEGWRKLADLLGMQSDEMVERLRRHKGKEFIYVQRQLSPETGRVAMDLKLQGLYAKREFKRYYPAGEVAAHIVGITDIDEKGQEGIELAFDEYLRGVNGSKKVLKDRRGYVIKDLSLLQDAQSGTDLRLSIDLRLQYMAYRELKAAVEAHHAKSGSLVILDVRTGEVLAMVNQPSFNPNNRDSMNPSGLRNRAVTDLFEPGSTVKPLSIAAALKTGSFTTETRINTSPGFLRLNGQTIRDARDYGTLDLVSIITKSSNVGTSKVALKIGGEAVFETFYQAGFGQSSGIEFPGEAVGVLPNFTKWQPIRLATLSYGYGLSVTTLQLAQSYMAIAADGVRRPVSLIKGGQQGVSPQEVMSPGISKHIREMLETVVLKGGTGTRAHVAEYRVAGKTGTTHKVGEHGYADDAYNAVFAGLAPVEKPRLAMAILMNEPQGSEYYGGEVSAPVFARVVANALRLLNVAPDRAIPMVAGASGSDSKRNGG